MRQPVQLPLPQLTSALLCELTLRRDIYGLGTLYFWLYAWFLWNLRILHSILFLHRGFRSSGLASSTSEIYFCNGCLLAGASCFVLQTCKSLISDIIHCYDNFCADGICTCTPRGNYATQYVILLPCHFPCTFACLSSGHAACKESTTNAGAEINGKKDFCSETRPMIISSGRVCLAWQSRRHMRLCISGTLLTRLQRLITKVFGLIPYTPWHGSCLCRSGESFIL